MDSMEDALLFIATAIDTSGLPGANIATSDRLQTVLNIVFAIAGAIALLVITIAGFHYVLSQGNPQEVAKSKNAIIYAGVGLILLILATAIVNFVIAGVT